MRKKPKPAKRGVRHLAPAQARAEHLRRHEAALKAAATRRKDTAAAKAGRPVVKKPVKRKLALGEAVACCAAEALAASLRLTGWPVSDRDVLALYELTADDEDEGATIEATLEAAAEHGLACVHLVGASGPGSTPAFPAALAGSRGYPQLGSLILGLELPEGPHAVCDDGTAWWSWGQPWDPASFPSAVIGEAWEVTWPS